jgi:hypothetical protein
MMTSVGMTETQFKNYSSSNHDENDMESEPLGMSLFFRNLLNSYMLIQEHKLQFKFILTE